MPSADRPHPLDVAIIGAGAAGLMCAITAATENPQATIGLFDSARKPGAKINISGGGRCNVTHAVVGADDFCGSTRPAIAKVLRRFTVDDTVAFFTRMGIALKREDTGKLFPVSDRAKDISSGLIRHATSLGVQSVFGNRVDRIVCSTSGFAIDCDQQRFEARRVVLATGGQSLPKTGSDGHGYEIARALGHTTTQRLYPALVPLLLPETDPLRLLQGVSLPVTLSLTTATGRHVHRATGAMLCTHFGISGPVVLDMSRHVDATRADDPHCRLLVSWLPDLTPDDVDDALRSIARGTVLEWIEGHVPKRLAGVLMQLAHVDATQAGNQLTRVERRRLVNTLVAHPLSILGSRGWRFAEVTAGGIPLSEANTATMASRVCAGLYLSGEILDVDGRIGGFNFQWAWASGFVAGSSCASELRPTE